MNWTWDMVAHIVVSELERWQQENGIFRAILGCRTNSRPDSKMKQTTKTKNLGCEEIPHSSLPYPKILGALISNTHPSPTLNPPRHTNLAGKCRAHMVRQNPHKVSICFSQTWLCLSLVVHPTKKTSQARGTVCLSLLTLPGR